jgi:hypothetical protein
MPRALCSLLLVLVIVSVQTYAQETDVPWLSLKRLSVTAGAAYHYNPWKKYNESMSLAQDAIRYNPNYPNPQGGLEKVFGDGTFRIRAGYRVISGFSLNVGAGFMRTGGTIRVSWNPSILVYPGGYPAPGPTRSANQEMQLNVPEYGAGFQYTYNLDDSFGISVSTLVSCCQGSFRFKHTYEYASWKYDFSADLKETKVGAVAGVELTLNAFAPLGIVSFVEYRWLRFPGLHGNGTYVYQEKQASWSYEESRPFEGRLGEADGYFGLLITPSNQSVADYVLHQLWQSAPVQPWWKTQQSAVLDLSGFGIGLGVRYAF